MREKLRDYLIPKIVLVAALLLGVTVKGHTQTILSPGDVIVVNANSDSPDSFDFVPLVNLQSGTTLYFTDNAYIANKKKLDNSEGTIKYVAPSDQPAGRVISYNNSDGFTEVSGSYNASGSGDNLIVYQAAADTTYLYGVGWARGSTVWNYQKSPSSNRSDIPPGLSETDNTILSLGTTANYQYDARAGLEGTRDSLLALVGDANHWKENDDNSFGDFSSSFILLASPTLSFSSETLSGDEGTTVSLTVKLVEANNTPVSARVAFLGSSSSANPSDFTGGYAPQTISFSASDASGTTKHIELKLKDDGSFEGEEKAVFQLQNITTGTIVDPATTTLTIHDADAPDVVINEFLADPPSGSAGDANGDGSRDGHDDEFVEMVNNGSENIDLTGWQLSDNGGGSIIYTFPSGTVLPAGRAIVVFGGGNPKGNFGGARVQTASGLSLKNSSGHVTLLDNNGNIIQDVSYDDKAAHNESMTRDPDITGNFVRHSNATDAKDAIYSPGTRVDGSPFGTKHAIGIRGTEGWRMVASPVQDATFSDFFGNFWMQGIPGSNDPAGSGTIYSWDETGGGAFTVPGDMSNDMQAGKGYIVYFFRDDKFNTPGIQGGFPKIINSDKNENSGSVSVKVSATDADHSGSIDHGEGWNLLGNPFDTDISVDKVINQLKNVSSQIQDHVKVWDHSAGSGNGDWVDLNDKDQIAPFQAFFVRFDAPTSGSVNFEKSTLAANKGTEFYKQVEPAYKFNLELHGDQYYDTYHVEFRDDGSVDLNRHDAYKLSSLNANSITLYSLLQNNKLQKKVLPKNLKSTVEIPLSFDASGRRALVFKWNNIESIPNDWRVMLIDKKMDRKIDLSSSKEYRFTASEEEQAKLKSTDNEKKLLKQIAQNNNARFALSIQPEPGNTNTSSNDLPESVKLNPNYPNPFNPTTRISYEVTKKSKVTLTVWNMIGQKVATLVDGVVDPGEHEETWNASNMPSGIYIARFQVGGKVFTRKMTLIK